jgi:hypothetical protein
VPYCGVYLMSGDHIVAPENLEAADDADAMLKAGELLSSCTQPRIEVWQGKRLIGRSGPTQRRKRSVGCPDVSAALVEPDFDRASSIARRMAS